ncbi:hypothetical protein AVEN_253935-2-1, partial [Araneus ventricosus]
TESVLGAAIRLERKRFRTKTRVNTVTRYYYMGPCDDLPAKPELLHWGTMRRARRDLVTRLCCASVNSAIKEHGVMCRLTATAFDENDPSVRTLMKERRHVAS